MFKNWNHSSFKSHLQTCGCGGGHVELCVGGACEMESVAAQMI